MCEIIQNAVELECKSQKKVIPVYREDPVKKNSCKDFKQFIAN